MRLHLCMPWLVVAIVSSPPVWSDNEICQVSTVDGTVENGVGAEAGVLREFVQDLFIS